MENYKTLSKRDQKELAVRHYKDWQGSGLSKSEYCRQNNLKPTTFAGWKRYLKTQGNTKLTKISSKAAKGFIPVKTGLELTISQSLSMKINPDFDPVLLKQVLEALGVLHDN
jgi:hypothetical protein